MSSAYVVNIDEPKEVNSSASGRSSMSAKAMKTTAAACKYMKAAMSTVTSPSMVTKNAWDKSTIVSLQCGQGCVSAGCVQPHSHF